jgi:hypothetical protein
MREAAEPFEFVTATYLTRINNQKATSLAELLKGLDVASDASVFHHTFQSLGTHHFLTEGFSNDFAQWALAALNRPELAERLGGIDVRDYTSLAALRGDLRRIVADHCTEHPQQCDITAFEPFYFCEAVEVDMPLGIRARTLEEFRACIARASHASFYYHFISSRLRLQLQTSDFAVWLQTRMGLDRLAQSINRIDIYTNTLDTARDQVVRLIDGELQRR